MASVFIVSSPLQLMNCLEARYRYRVNKSYLLVFLIEAGESVPQYENLVSMEEWEKVIYLESPAGAKGLMTFPKDFKVSVSDLISENIEYLFVGEYRSPYVNHMVNFFDANKVILVDDGMAVLNYENFFRSRSIYKRLRRTLYYMVGYKAGAFSYCQFSAFYLERSSAVVNDYRWLKRGKKNYALSDDVWFLGQPLVELAIMSPQNWMLYIEKVMRRYKRGRFCYVMHRRNDSSFIEAASQKLGFKCIRFDRPIELEFLELKTIPHEVITAYSTAIFTLSKLVADIRCSAYRLPTTSIKYENHPYLDLEPYYYQFERAGITLID